MLNFLIAIVFVYLGLVIGYIISNFSKEELEIGKKYFIFFKAVLFSSILFVFLQHIQISFYISIPITTIIFIGTYFWIKNYTTYYNEIFFSCILAVAFSEVFSPIISLFIFSFFIFSSAIEFKEGLFNILKTRILFLIIGLIIKTQYVLQLFQ